MFSIRKALSQPAKPCFIFKTPFCAPAKPCFNFKTHFRKPRQPFSKPFGTFVVNCQPTVSNDVVCHIEFVFLLLVIFFLQGLLHLADKFFAAVVAEQGSVAVDEEHLRNGLQSVVVGRERCCVDDLRVWYAELLGGFLMFGNSVAHINTHDNKVFAAVLLVQRYQHIRDFFPARTAPRCPKVDNSHFAWPKRI